MNFLLIIGIAFWDSLFLIGFGISGGALFAASLVLLHQDSLSLKAIWASALFGVVVGDNLSFWVGRLFGSTLEARASPNAIKRIAQAQRLVQRYGLWGIAAGRFFWATRKIVPFVCGSAGFPYKRFAIIDFVICGIWVSLWCSVLYLTNSRGFDFLRDFRLLLL